MSAPDPLTLAIEAAVERAVERQIAAFRSELPALLAAAVAGARSEPLLPAHEHLGCSAAAWRMRVHRTAGLADALRQIERRDGRTVRYLRSDLERVLAAVDHKPVNRDTSRARAARLVKCGLRLAAAGSGS